MTVTIEDRRRQFWDAYRQTDLAAGIEPTRDSNVWLPLTQDASVVLSLSISQDRSSVFLRGRRGAPVDTAQPFVERHRIELSQGLRILVGDEADTAQGRWFRKNHAAAFTLRSKWPEITRWFSIQRRLYTDVIGHIEQQD
ncbi:hypothetical protein FHG66_11335 [Rubellimicrobium rubrum]|uniref:DUF4268 domain-containing protein n=1 Tax=Rubellimicrobium rubrum TaxID=2585369 RepID=A0A5C4MXH2_9RHOB|nr:hypothetical protein [Rubellimicrobium rubrum]TNC49319.1 hypothetical protein FHG66_11335 [Rubellimicrobium rubrum]